MLSRICRLPWLCAWLLLTLASVSAHAVDAELVKQLSLGDSSAKSDAIGKMVAAGDTGAIPLLQALLDGALHLAGGTRAVIVTDKATLDALTMKPVEPVPADLDKVSINNRIRRELGSALAALKLSSPDKVVRLAAAKELEKNADQDMLPLIGRALEKETDEKLKAILLLTQAALSLKNSDPKVRLEAVRALAQSNDTNARSLLSGMLEKNTSGEYAEPDAKVRAEIAQTLKTIESRLSGVEILGGAFYGLSLGSILLLAALGLAITFGLMGIINMAHGEFLMIGAYTTYVVQVLFKSHFPEQFDWYLPLALPAAFLTCALIGMVLERCVIRFLYGRPLETLLATWGISLMLIQAVRTLFGAQNVEVANPSWMSGGVSFIGGLVLPYNRIVIIGFALFVLAMVWLLLNRTRLGLFVRAVTQNRGMAGCVGVPTPKVDMLTFGLGSGIAGLGGCALSQIGNVGPDLGQSYIVDSFMVVVLGGVGQLSGTVIAAIGLGEVNKFLEPYAGAVLAKIAVLVFIIFFIQKRPQGLFALKGRIAET